METFNKTIKKLTDKEYEDLRNAVAGGKSSKPYILLEAARTQNYNDSEMMEKLEVNQSAYYTMKSRLNQKIATYFSKKVDNPISVLKEEVARVPAMMFTSNRKVTTRALTDLEKKLLDYDLSNELIVVYKSLARLHLYTPDYDFYEKLYNKHVAFSLAVVKAEDLFFEFTKRLGIYLLTREERDLEEVKTTLREITNYAELYTSHRLFVLHNIVRTYYLCALTTRRENLKSMEVELDTVLQEIKKIFDRFPIDTFYQNIRLLPDLLYFEYYQKTDNSARADYHYDRVNKEIPAVAAKKILTFYVIRYLQAKIERYLSNGNVNELTDINKDIEHALESDPGEDYHFISAKMFFATCKFYHHDFNGAAKAINEMRNELSMKKYLYADVECKLFQALQYAMMGEDGLCNQIIQSIRRQIGEEGDRYQQAELFMKILKAALKAEELRRKIKRITDLWQQFTATNTGVNQLLWFVKLDENLIRKLANPIKS
jgi:hypothetical protein